MYEFIPILIFLPTADDLKLLEQWMDGMTRDLKVIKGRVKTMQLLYNSLVKRAKMVVGMVD